MEWVRGAQWSLLWAEALFGGVCVPESRPLAHCRLSCAATAAGFGSVGTAGLPARTRRSRSWYRGARRSVRSCGFQVLDPSVDMVKRGVARPRDSSFAASASSEAPSPCAGIHI